MKKIIDISPEKRIYTDEFYEECAQRWFECLIENRGIKNLSELKDYIVYLEDIEFCYENIKKKIADINHIMI